MQDCSISITNSLEIPQFSTKPKPSKYAFIAEYKKIRLYPALIEVILTTKSSYRKTSNIRSTLVGNEIVDHSDVVGAWPVGAAPTTSSFST